MNYSVESKHAAARLLLSRGMADLNRELYLEQQRTAALTERLAVVEGDVERMQKHIGKLVRQT